MSEILDPSVQSSFRKPSHTAAASPRDLALPADLTPAPPHPLTHSGFPSLSTAEPAGPDANVPECPTMSRISELQRWAIEYTLIGCNDSEVAAEVGINRRTLLRWRQNPDFIEVLRFRSATAFADTRARLTSLIDTLIREFFRQLNSNDDEIRTDAAKALRPLLCKLLTRPPPS